MGLKDLKLLKEKENRLYLILILWLLIGFTMFQFEVLYVVGYIVFIPLIIISFILFLTALLSLKKFSEMSKKRIIISIIIFILLSLLFFNLFYTLLLYLFLLAIISFIIITSVFTMYYFYILGIRIDDFLYNLPSSVKKFERWLFFIGGIIFSILLIIGAVIISELITGGTGKAIGFNTSAVALIIVAIIIFFAIIGLRGRLNVWMGIFFVWVAIYTIYLMISIIYSRISVGGGNTLSIPIQILLYFFNLFLLLWTIGGLIGEKAKIIKEKLRIFGSDTIVMWLIFSMASFEFASAGIETMDVDIFRYIAVYVLFIPLLFIMGIYGIYNYGNIIKERSIKKLENEAKKEGIIEKEQVICTNCGAINEEGAKFCTSCSKEII